MEYKCCESEFFIQIMAVVMLVVFAGIMSGLTMGLMSMGIIDLEVLAKSGNPKDRLHASKILTVVKRQHLLLCTLILFHSAAIMTLPIFLDKLVSKSVAILVSVILVFLFAKTIPEALCSQYGLAIGAAMTPVVRALVWISFPVTYPISKLLDSLLGKEHEPLFRRAELKTLVDFHSALAGKGGELSHHETSIISGALQLTEKTARDAMTPLSETFSININTKLNREVINLIMEKGHSRVPVYYEHPKNIIGLILVKNLLTINPADELPVKHAIIRRIPQVSETMPLYDILNEFQKGLSHMAIVVKHHHPNISTEQTPRLCLSSGYIRELRIEIHDGALSETKSATSIRSLRNLPGSSRVSSRINSRSRRWSSGSLYSEILELNELPLSTRTEDVEVVGIISMEDIIEELLNEEIYDETDHYYNHL